MKGQFFIILVLVAALIFMIDQVLAMEDVAEIIQDLPQSEFKDDPDAKRILETPEDEPFKLLDIKTSADSEKLNVIRDKYLSICSAKVLASKDEYTKKICSHLDSKIKAAKKLVLSLLSVGVIRKEDINKKGWDGKTALHVALETKNELLASCLLKMGADSNVEYHRLSKGSTSITETPLNIAIEKRCSTRIITCLLEHGADAFKVRYGSLGIGYIPQRAGFVFDVAFQEKESGYTDAFNAIKGYEKAKLEQALKGEKNLLDPNAICRAAMIGASDLIDTLLRVGLNASTKDECNRYPIFYAVRNNDKKSVEMILQFGADPNSPVTSSIYQSGSQPEYRIIHCAVANGFEDIVKILLKFGANPNAECEIHNQYAETGPKINILHQTPLGLAIAHKSSASLFEALIKFGANIYHSVCIKDYGKGAWGEPVSEQNKSMLEYAKYCNNSEAEQLLESEMRKRAIRKILVRAWYKSSAFVKRYNEYEVGRMATIKRKLRNLVEWFSKQNRLIRERLSKKLSNN